MNKNQNVEEDLKDVDWDVATVESLENNLISYAVMQYRTVTMSIMFSKQEKFIFDCVVSSLALFLFFIFYKAITLFI